MEVGEDLRADAKLSYVTELAPDEPTPWANLALMAMRRNDAAGASDLLTRALELAPGHPDILFLAAAHARLIGTEEEQIAFLRRAVASDTTHIRAAFELLRLLPESDPSSDALLDILDTHAPANAVVALERIARSLNAGTLDAALLTALAARNWGSEATGQLAALEAAVQTGDASSAQMQLAFLRNVLLGEPEYRQDLASVSVPVERVADPIVEFSRLEAPNAAPSPADDSLDFVYERLAPWTLPRQGWIAGVALGNEGLPAVFFSDGDSLRTLRQEAWASPGAVGQYAIAGVDYNFDFRTDLVMAGPAGLALLRQDSTEVFEDVTSTLGLGSAVLNTSYRSVWVADLDLEGDVDLVLAERAGPVHTLRNNGDGTFSPADWLSGVMDVQAFAWADLDLDGDPDAALVDGSGALHVLDNERQGRFSAVPVAGAPSDVMDLMAADSDSDGRIELLLLTGSGSIHRLTSGHEWTSESVVTGASPSSQARLLAGDIDNNGGLDLIMAGESEAHVWLQQDDYSFVPHPVVVTGQVFGLGSIREAGRLDLVGLDAEGQPMRAAVLTTQGYHWKQIRPRAAQAVGDQRINSFGIGGEVELRAGRLYQKQPITQPIMHFGLGHQTLADVARITWPNGSVQAEFDLLSDQIVSATQRLKGSCPWLFAWNGDEMEFVTDFIWRSPLGLRINAQETAGIMTTEDWVKIRRDQLAPRDGFYEVRITAELWETHFFDHVSLLVVDHPSGTEIHIDERFAFPPPELAVHVTGKPASIAGGLGRSRSSCNRHPGES